MDQSISHANDVSVGAAEHALSCCKTLLEEKCVDSTGFSALFCDLFKVWKDSHLVWHGHRCTLKVISVESQRVKMTLTLTVELGILSDLREQLHVR